MPEPSEFYWNSEQILMLFPTGATVYLAGRLKVGSLGDEMS